MILRQFGAHVAVAIENARLFEHERDYTGTLETLSEIGREFGSILNLDELLTRIANLTRRVIDYRTFGILLVDEATQRARDEGRGPLWRQVTVAAREDRGRAGRLRGAPQGSRSSCPTSRRIRATSTWSTTRARSW